MKRTSTPTGITTAVLTLITVLLWAGFGVYRALTIAPEQTVPEDIIRPLDPKLDTNTLDTLQTRLSIDEKSIEATPGPTTTPIPTSTPLPSGSGTPTPIPTSTP